jgi:hypothetical protein
MEEIILSYYCFNDGVWIYDGTFATRSGVSRRIILYFFVRGWNERDAIAHSNFRAAGLRRLTAVSRVKTTVAKENFPCLGRCVTLIHGVR